MARVFLLCNKDVARGFDAMINVVELNFHHRIRSGFAVQNHLTAEYIADVVSERTSERKNFGFCTGQQAEADLSVMRQGDRLYKSMERQ